MFLYRENRRVWLRAVPLSRESSASAWAADSELRANGRRDGTSQKLSVARIRDRIESGIPAGRPVQVHRENVLNIEAQFSPYRNRFSLVHWKLSILTA